jgi:hypothetical protein
VAYTRQTWADEPSTSTPVSAARLNYMEAGIEAANGLQAGDVRFVKKNPDGTWPARPTSRADVLVIWDGPDPSPPIVASGTGGMLNNVDKRYVTP